MKATSSLPSKFHLELDRRTNFTTSELYTGIFEGIFATKSNSEGKTSCS